MLKIGWISFVFLAQFPVAQAFCGEIDTPLGASDIATFIALWPETSKALAAADPEFEPALTNGLRGQLRSYVTRQAGRHAAVAERFDELIDVRRAAAAQTRDGVEQ